MQLMFLGRRKWRSNLAVEQDYIYPLYRTRANECFMRKKVSIHTQPASDGMMRKTALSTQW